MRNRQVSSSANRPKTLFDDNLLVIESFISKDGEQSREFDPVAVCK